MGDGDGEGEVLGRLEDSLGVEEVVPTGEEGDEEEGTDHGADGGEGDGEEEADFAAAVDAGGFEHFEGDAGEHGLAEEEDEESGADGGEDEAGEGVEQAEAEDELIGGGDEHGAGDNEGGEDDAGEDFAAFEMEHGEGIAAHRGDEGGEDAGGAREEEGVDDLVDEVFVVEEVRVVFGGEGVPHDVVVLVVGKKEPGRIAFVVLDGRQGHIDERHQRDEGEEAEDEMEADTFHFSSDRLTRMR